MSNLHQVHTHPDCLCDQEVIVTHGCTHCNWILEAKSVYYWNPRFDAHYAGATNKRGLIKLLSRHHRKHSDSEHAMTKPIGYK